MDKEFMKDFHVLPTSKGYTVFHSLSYRFFEIDDVAGRVLLSFENGNENILESEVNEAKDLLLRELGENIFSLKNNTLGDGDGNGNGLVGFYLFVSQDCNLQCSYCYGDGGDYGKERMLMDETTANNFLDRFIDGREKEYGINFFGGEPLLNFSLMKKVVKDAKEKARKMNFKITFNLTTNGTVWNEEIKRFIEEHITNVTVSLDGPKEINDIQRVPRGDFSPHDRTMKTLNELREMKSSNLVIRTIVTKNSYNKMREVYRYNMPLAPGGIGITTVDVGDKHPLAISEEEHSKMVEDIIAINSENLATFTNSDNPSFCEHTLDLFDLMFFKKYRPGPCNTGRTVAAIAADGEIYPCHRFVGFNEFLIGNVNNKEPLNGNYPQVLNRFKKALVGTMEQCSYCWVRYMCGGCCYVISYLREGDLSIPWKRYCYLKKKVYHSMLTDFIEIMTDPIKKEKLVSNVKKTLRARGGVAC